MPIDCFDYAVCHTSKETLKKSEQKQGGEAAAVLAPMMPGTRTKPDGPLPPTIEEDEDEPTVEYYGDEDLGECGEEEAAEEDAEIAIGPGGNIEPTQSKGETGVTWQTKTNQESVWLYLDFV